MKRLEVENGKQEIRIRLLEAENQALAEFEASKSRSVRVKKRVDKEEEEVEEVVELESHVVEMEGNMEVLEEEAEGELVLVNLKTRKNQWPGQVIARSGNQVTVKIFDKNTSERMVEAIDVGAFVYNESLVKSTKNNELANAYRKANKMTREMEDAVESEGNAEVPEEEAEGYADASPEQLQHGRGKRMLRIPRKLLD